MAEKGVEEQLLAMERLLCRAFSLPAENNARTKEKRDSVAA